MQRSALLSSFTRHKWRASPARPPRRPAALRCWALQRPDSCATPSSGSDPPTPVSLPQPPSLRQPRRGLLLAAAGAAALLAAFCLPGRRLPPAPAAPPVVAVPARTADTAATRSRHERAWHSSSSALRAHRASALPLASVAAQHGAPAGQARSVPPPSMPQAAPSQPQHPREIFWLKATLAVQQVLAAHVVVKVRCP